MAPGVRLDADPAIGEEAELLPGEIVLRGAAVAASVGNLAGAYKRHRGYRIALQDRECDAAQAVKAVIDSDQHRIVRRLCGAAHESLELGERDSESCTRYRLHLSLEFRRRNAEWIPLSVPEPMICECSNLHPTISNSKAHGGTDDIA